MRATCLQHDWGMATQVRVAVGRIQRINVTAQAYRLLHCLTRSLTQSRMGQALEASDGSNHRNGSNDSKDSNASTHTRP
jgi:hypothetical protein